LLELIGIVAGQVDQQSYTKASGGQPKGATLIPIVSCHVDYHGIAMVPIRRGGDHAAIAIVASKIDDQTKPSIQLIGVRAESSDHNESVRTLFGVEHVPGHAARRFLRWQRLRQSPGELMEPPLVRETRQHLGGRDEIGMIDTLLDGILGG
jgi:hypothetical protein